MKIVDVNPYFYPWLGGIEHRMHRLAKEFAKRGHEVTIITGRLPDTEPEETVDGYRIIRLESKLYKIYQPPYISSKGLLETLEKIQPDIVNFNYRWAPSYTKDMSRYKGLKSFTYHNMFGEGAGWQKIPSTVNDKLFNRKLKDYDFIFFVSEAARIDFEKKAFKCENSAIAPPCLETYPDVKNIEENFILTVTRLVKVKGIKYLVEAMKNVDCKLIICGTGPEEDNLKKQIKENGLEDKIEMKGFVSDEEKCDLQSKCKLTVIPSLSETFCLAAVESMSYGHPIVCSNVNALPYTVGEGGVSVPPKDPIALADAINSLLADDSKRKTMGAKAREISEQYSSKAVADTILREYEKLLSHSE